jgi:hypothetical protein
MNDREMLELAAKAAGHKIDWYIPTSGSDEPYIDGRVWNPLTDDADALRLAVKLGLSVGPHPKLKEMECWIFPISSEHSVQVCEPVGNDAFAATRRAIVRAAAEIGKGMK